MHSNTHCAVKYKSWYLQYIIYLMMGIGTACTARKIAKKANHE